MHQEEYSDMLSWLSMFIKSPAIKRSVDMDYYTEIYIHIFMCFLSSFENPLKGFLLYQDLSRAFQ